MENLLTFKFWFSSRSGYFIEPIHYGFIALIAVFVAAGIVLVFAKKKKMANRKTLASLASFCFTNSLLLGLIMFLSYEEVPVLSARIWLAIWALEMAAWIYFIISYYKKYLAKKDELIKQQEFKRYLP